MSIQQKNITINSGVAEAGAKMNRLCVVIADCGAGPSVRERHPIDQNHGVDVDAAGVLVGSARVIAVCVMKSLSFDTNRK
jgi:hypothetical protein